MLKSTENVGCPGANTKEVGEYGARVRLHKDITVEIPLPLRAMAPVVAAPVVEEEVVVAEVVETEVTEEEQEA